MLSPTMPVCRMVSIQEDEKKNRVLLPSMFPTLLPTARIQHCTLQLKLGKSFFYWIIVGQQFELEKKFRKILIHCLKIGDCGSS